jgi:hypothetical protein
MLIKNMVTQSKCHYCSQGTNAAIAKELIDNSGMPILSAVEFQ